MLNIQMIEQEAELVKAKKNNVDLLRKVEQMEVEIEEK